MYRIKSRQTAIYENRKNLRHNNPEEVKRVIIQRKGESNIMENFVFTDNSPLVPYFGPCCMYLYANAILNILEIKWMGKELESKVSDILHPIALNVGEMM